MSTASGLLGLISEQLHNAIKKTASDADFITIYIVAPVTACRGSLRAQFVTGITMPLELAQTKPRPIGGRRCRVGTRPFGAVRQFATPSHYIDFPIAAIAET